MSLTNYLLVIEINNYPSGKHLENSSMEIEKLKKNLMKKLGLKNQNILHLINKEITLFNLSETFRLLGNEIGNIDTLIVYFAGLEKTVNGETNWRIYNENFEEELLPLNTLRSLFRIVNAKKVLFITETDDLAEVDENRETIRFDFSFGMIYKQRDNSRTRTLPSENTNKNTEPPLIKFINETLEKAKDKIGIIEIFSIVKMKSKQYNFKWTPQFVWSSLDGNRPNIYFSEGTQITSLDENSIENQREDFAFSLCGTKQDYIKFLSLFSNSNRKSILFRRLNELSTLISIKELTIARKKLSEGKIDEVLKILISKKNSFDGEVMILSNRWQRLKLDHNVKGIISYQDANLESNKINDGLISLIKIMENEIKTTDNKA